MRVLIVDDEKPAREKLRRLLLQEAGITIAGEAADAIEALDLVARERPDLVFLDIQMPEVSGIELAASLPQPGPLLVFVTAFDRYAIDAFDTGAIDYLLKPYDEARLQRALVRARERLAARSTQPPPKLPLAQLLVTERGVTRVVRVADIQWIETADNYVILHTATGQPLLRQTLSGLLDRLGEGFQRCHRRAAVQTSWIESIVALGKGDCELVLRGGARVPCSRQYSPAITAQL